MWKPSIWVQRSKPDMYDSAYAGGLHRRQTGDRRDLSGSNTRLDLAPRQVSFRSLVLHLLFVGGCGDVFLIVLATWRFYCLLWAFGLFLNVWIIFLFFAQSSYCCCCCCCFCFVVVAAVVHCYALPLLHLLLLRFNAVVVRVHCIFRVCMRFVFMHI